MIKYTICPSGILYGKKTYLQEKITLEVEIRKNLIQQISPVSTAIFRPNNGWEKSNEPEEHLDEMARIITRSVKEPKILCFSYKDKTLAERLGKGKSNYDILFDAEEGIIKKSPEDITVGEFRKIIKQHLINYNLFIMRHYLEHYSETEELIHSLASIMRKDPNIYSYIEVPDCEKFIKEKNPLFIWEQHKVYFTRASIRYHLLKSNLKIIFEESYGCSIEPSLCFVVCNEAKKNNLVARDYIIDKRYELENLRDYTEDWHKYLENNERPKVLYGIGHNSDRFLQFTNTKKYFNFFVDGNPEKRGYYLANTDRAIENNISLPRDSGMEIVIGVHDRNFNVVSNKIMLEYPKAIITSIFNFPNR